MLLEKKSNKWALNEAKEIMSVDEFSEKVKKMFLKQFPKAWINGGWTRGLGEFVAFSFGIQPKKKISHDIVQNDPGFQDIMIWNGVKDKTFKDKITAESNSGGSLMIKPEEGSYMAYGRVKFG